VLAAVYAVEWFSAPAVRERLVATLGLEPRQVTLVWRHPGLVTGSARAAELGERVLLPLFGHALLHAGVLHLLANLVFLRLFGGAIERLAGARRLLLLLWAGVVAGGLAQIWHDPLRARTLVGASGGLFALAGAYFVRCPHARVLLALPIVVWPVFVELPAWVLGIAFAALQVPPVLELVAPAEVGSTAWPAHAGGLAAGALLGLLLVPRPPVQPAAARR
jgi:membrane associated rhomboid family serine protease